MKLTSTDDYINERMKNPEFKKGFEEAQRQDNAANEIYDLRNNMGLSRRQLAKRSGISKKVITRIEEGDMEFTDESMKIMEQVLRSLGKDSNSPLAYQK